MEPSPSTPAPIDPIEHMRKMAKHVTDEALYLPAVAKLVVAAVAVIEAQQVELAELRKLVAAWQE